MIPTYVSVTVLLFTSIPVILAFLHSQPTPYAGCLSYYNFFYFVLHGSIILLIQ